MYNVYTGERVRIRPFRSVEEWTHVISEEQQEPNDHWGYWHWPRAEARKEFEKGGLLATDKYSAFAVERLDTGEFIGYEEYGGILPGRCATWIGTFIRRPHWHNGFGIEAKLLNLCNLFENYPLRMVFADTTQTHVRAQNGLKACGLEYVGARRKAHCYHGRYVDVVQYQIMREDWEQLPIRGIVKRGVQG